VTIANRLETLLGYVRVRGTEPRFREVPSTVFLCVFGADLATGQDRRARSEGGTSEEGMDEERN